LRLANVQVAYLLQLFGQFTDHIAFKTAW